MTSAKPLRDRGLSTGKKARLQRILFQHGLRNGTALFLPYDQGLEHGPRDFFANPAAGDPAYIVKLALEAGFNGIAIQIGLAEKFYWDYAGEVPIRAARPSRPKAARTPSTPWTTRHAQRVNSGKYPR